MSIRRRASPVANKVRLKTSNRRRLRVERLDQRRLLAADLGHEHEHGPAGVDVELGVFTPAEIEALENVPVDASLSTKTPGATDGNHASNTLTFVLDFKSASQGTTSDIFGNVVTDFDVTDYGFAASDFDTISELILRNVEKDYFQDLVGAFAGPNDRDLAVNFVIGDIGTNPGFSEYYFVQIGEGISGPHSGGTLGVATAGGVRTSGGLGPSFGISSGDVVASVFTDAINGLTNLVPTDALTAGYLDRTGHAITGTLSHEIGHTLSLSHINKANSVQPTPGVSPIMGTGAIDLPSIDRISDREFSLAGFDGQNGNTPRQHVQQLANAAGLHIIPDGSISGVVYADANEDGQRQVTEGGIGGQVVFADYDNDNTLDTDEPFATTSSDGSYTINGVTQDYVMVRRVQGSDFDPTFPLPPSLVITEFSEQTPDFVEFQNVTGETLDLTGWTVLISGGFDQDLRINQRHPNSFTFSSTLASRGLISISDSPTDLNFWGSNLNFVTSTGGWVLLLDDSRNVRDSFFAGFSDAEIADFNITFDGNTITADDLDWIGGGAPLVLDSTQSYQRRGIGDTNRSTDFAIRTITKDLVNPGLADIFPDNSSGQFVETVGGTAVVNVDFGNVGDVTISGSSVVFAATLPDGQRELHITDGTPLGTGLLKDISGSASSDPQDFVWAGNRIYFSATLPSGERELFKTTGTESTSNLVRNISGGVSSDPQELTAVESRLYFTAERPDGQRELFRTRGTASNTVQVADIGGSISSNPSDLVTVGNTLYFAATGADGQRELYRTQGNASSTQIVRDISGGASSDPKDLTRVGDKFYFTAVLPSGERELFVSDGTASGTQLARNLSGSTSASPANLTAFGDRVYFTATLPSGETELFFSRGTVASTNLLDNLAGPVSAGPSWLTVVDDKLFFTARTATGERELYATDGTRSGTDLVRDISGGVSAEPRQLVAVGDRLAFTAVLPSGERELFRSNGTSSGTVMVENLSGSRSSNPSNLTAIGNELLFTAIMASGQRELHLSNLVASGTGLLANLSGTTSSSPSDLTAASFASPGSTADSASQGERLADNSRPIPQDANDDGLVSPNDALVVLNHLSRFGTQVGDDVSNAYLDTNLDGKVSPADALQVVNYLMLESAAQVSVPVSATIGNVEVEADDSAVQDLAPLESDPGSQPKLENATRLDTVERIDDRQASSPVSASDDDQALDGFFANLDGELEGLIH